VFTKGSSPMNAAIPVEEAYKILACNWCLFSYNKWHLIFTVLG
jgi:hypothetical protein